MSTLKFILVFFIRIDIHIVYISSCQDLFMLDECFLFWYLFKELMSFKQFLGFICYDYFLMQAKFFLAILLKTVQCFPRHGNKQLIILKFMTK